MRALIILIVLAVGCDEPPPPDPDAGHDAGAVDATVGPMLSPVAPAEMPRFECPDGWAPTALAGGPTVCDPYPGGHLDCGPNERQLPGEATCVRLGPDCPAGDYEDDEPATGIVYVKAGATMGDGTRAAPFGIIADAVAAAADGDTVLVAVGTYEREMLTLMRPVTIRGVCLDAVLGARSSVSTESPGVRLENLRFDGASRGPVAFSGDLTMRSIAIRNVPQIALAGFGGDLDLEDVSIRRGGEEGLRVTSGSHLTARRLDIEDVGVVILACNDATCDIEDAALIQHESGPFVESSIRLSNTTARLERVLIDNEIADSLVVISSTLQATDLVIRGPAASVAIDDPALFVIGGAQVELTRAWISDMHVVGVTAGEAGTSLTARDVVLTDTHPAASFGGGYGFFVTDGAEAIIERMWIERATGAAVLVTGAGTRLVASDLNVRRINPAADGFLGRGIQVQLSSVLEGTRIDVRDTPESGIIVSQGATATLADLVLSDIHERACVPACPAAGNGIAAYLGGTVLLERFQVSEVALAGLQIAMGGEMDASDGEVFDNPVGVNLQAEGYEVSRLTTNVLYRDNGVNLDSTSFEIPDPSAPPVPGL